MTIATLSEVLRPALADGYAVAGLVTLGWEDMRAFAEAAEEENCSVILQVGPSCREHTPLPVLGGMLRRLAEEASVPIVVHLDHGYCVEECAQAIDAGFSSVMYDGSRKPFQQNIDETSFIAEMARKAGVGCEGEIGCVGYVGGEASAGTDPREAAVFSFETGVDAIAISVGNVHLQRETGSDLDETRIEAIQAVTDIPLVIHGGSGVSRDQRQHLATTTNICKFNIGTELRMAFGGALREAVNRDPDRFDRVQILSEIHEPLKFAARAVLRNLKG